MADRLSHPVFALLALLAIAAWSAPLHAQADLPRAFGHFPSDTGVVFAWDLTAQENPRSALSLITIGDVRQQLAQSDPDLLAIDPDEPVGTASEVAGRLMLADGDFSAAVHSAAMALTATSFDPPDGDDYVVLLGDFTQREAGEALQRAAGRAGANGGTTFSFPQGTDGTRVHASAPEDGVLLISTRADWLEQAPGLASGRQGLMASDSQFVNAAMSLGGRRPDAMLYVSGALIQEGFRQTPPEARGLIGPFAQSRGLILATYPADKLRFELHSAFDNPQQANLASQFLTQSLSMAQMFLQSGIQQAQDPEEREMLQELSRALNEDVRITTSRNSALLRLEIERPDPETVREAMEGMLQAPFQPAF